MNTLYEIKPFRGIKGSCKTISGGHFFDEGEDHCMWCGKEEKRLTPSNKKKTDMRVVFSK